MTSSRRILILRGMRPAIQPHPVPLPVAESPRKPGPAVRPVPAPTAGQVSKSAVAHPALPPAAGSSVRGDILMPISRTNAESPPAAIGGKTGPRPPFCRVGLSGQKSGMEQVFTIC